MGILTVLQSHKFVMAEKIATKFEISVRTVIGYQSPDGNRIPISFEANRGYFVVQGIFFHCLFFFK